MAIDDLPTPVVTFLNAIGVPWPYINEDQLTHFATLTRQFGTAVQTTHQDAASTVAAIAAAHKAGSSDQMTEGFTRLMTQHTTEVVDGCHVLATALDAAADYVIAQKVAAIADLAEMAVEFIADQAAAVATAGIAEAAVPVIIGLGQKLMKSLVNDLEQYIIGEVANAAIKPLLAKVEQMVSGLDWSQSGTAGGGKGQGIELDAGAVAAQTKVMHQHASEMRAHAETFMTGLHGLGF